MTEWEGGTLCEPSLGHTDNTQRIHSHGSVNIGVKLYIICVNKHVYFVTLITLSPCWMPGIRTVNLRVINFSLIMNRLTSQACGSLPNKNGDNQLKHIMTQAHTAMTEDMTIATMVAWQVTQVKHKTLGYNGALHVSQTTNTTTYNVTILCMCCCVTAVLGSSK